MALALYAHPFSSYCQKVLMALYENGTAFEPRMLSAEEPAHGADFAALWPIEHMPVLLDGDRPVREATIIIEHLDLFHPGQARLIPEDPREALQVRFLDRVFDNYVMAPMQRIVLDFMRPAGTRDPLAVSRARELLDKAYRWLDAELPREGWAIGEGLGLADCAAAPSLLYADWVHAIPSECDNLRAYRARLLTRPSYARALDEARPFRPLFPPGAPERD